MSKKVRSNIQLLLGAVCVVALPAPILLATTAKGGALLRKIVPFIPTAVAADAAPKLAVQAAPVAAPTASPIQIQTLPTREITVTVENVNSGETARFLIGDGGRTRAEQAAAIEQFFRCRRTNRHKPLADGVLALLADIAQRWPGRTIEVVSGYRSPPFGTRHSRHFAGHAIDLRVRGVRTSKVRDYVWREHHEVGVGHYAQQDFLHVDSRPGHLDTAWSAPREDSKPQYDPRWARRVRRGLRTPAIPGALAVLTTTAHTHAHR
jgi:uncharacterized protein YcbK (DUF882 family)